MVWIYYDNVAVHRRAAWRFEVDVTHPDTLPSPAFVIAIGYGLAAFAQPPTAVYLRSASRQKMIGVALRTFPML